MKKLIMGLFLLQATTAFASVHDIHEVEEIKVRVYGEGRGSMDLAFYETLIGPNPSSNDLPGNAERLTKMECDGRLKNSYDCTQHFSVTLRRYSFVDLIRKDLGYKIQNLATGADTQNLEISIVCPDGSEKKLTDYPLYAVRNEDRSPFVRYVVSTEGLYSKRCVSNKNKTKN